MRNFRSSSHTSPTYLSRPVLPICLESRPGGATTQKAGLNTNDFKSFRPITNLTTLSKLLECLALARLKPHVVTSPNYSPLQSAYRAAHSTETAMVKIVDHILSIVDSGSVVALVGLDISAAFDTVSHRNLLSRFEHDFSMEGVALEWINSYLSKRTFFVRVGRSSSAVAQMCSGVPQDSVLGPFCSQHTYLQSEDWSNSTASATINMLMKPNSILPRPPIQMHVSTGWSHVQLDYNMVLLERSPPKPRQIRSLLLRYSAKVTTCRQAVVNQSCRMLHRPVRKTKNT